MLARMSDEIATEPTSAPTPRRWAVPAITAALGLLVGAGGVGAAWSISASQTGHGLSAAPSRTPAARSFSLSGSLTLANGVPDLAGTACKGIGGFADIISGAAVTVYDAKGTVVGSDSLENGHVAGSGSYGPCTFAFTVAGVPDGSNFYQVEISHRGKLTVSEADAKAGLFTSSLG